MTFEQITAIAAGIIEHMSDTGAGYCEVPSASRPGLSHRVYFNTKLYSVSCDCEAGLMRRDCGHRVAVDRHFDLKRSILTVDLVPHVEDSIRSYEGCDFCGRNHKSWNCPF